MNIHVTVHVEDACRVFEAVEKSFPSLVLEGILIVRRAPSAGQVSHFTFTKISDSLGSLEALMVLCLR